MSPKQTGLGRGLGSLIPGRSAQLLPKDSPVVPSSEQILQIQTTDIKPNPHQPRSDFNHEGLEELTDSIKKHGILQPLIAIKIDDGYQLIAGERRLRAAQLLDLPTVPVIVREAEAQQQLELALVENLQRRNLNPIEEAVSYQRLIDEFSLTQDQVADRVGKSRSAVANTLRFLSLPTEIQKAVVSGKISPSTARVIAGLPPEQRLAFFENVLKNDLTTRAAETEAKKVSVRHHVRKAKDPQIKSDEERLEVQLGTKVSIKKTGEAGKVIIEFFSNEEYEQLLDRLS